MTRIVRTIALACGALLVGVAACFAQDVAPSSEGPPPAGPTRVREIFVPFADLNVVLEADVQRIFLTRPEYEALLAKAKQNPQTPPPRAATLLSAQYDAKIEEGRALIAGDIVLEVLAPGLQALSLDLSGVGIRQALLDGRPAPLTRDAQGKPIVLVDGVGRKTLRLELVAPLETSAAWQSLHAQLPRPAAYKFRLAVPGNVEVKSGADVLSRSVDGAVTRFELLPRPGGEPLVMSLNNRQLLQQRVVMARSVVVDEVTQAYERLHASVSLSILRGAVEQFRFEVPAGFEVNEVDTPLLARWVVIDAPAIPAGKPDGKPAEKPDAAAPQNVRPGRVLEVTLREPTTEPVHVNITTTRLAPELSDWQLPRFQPLDVASHVAVVGLLVDERLKFDSLAARNLISIDAATITAALPASVLSADASAPRVRAAAAFYAPQSDYGLSAKFAPPTPKLNVVSNALLVLEERRQLVRGGFELRPEVERLFYVDFTVPAGWLVTLVKGVDGNPLPFESFPAAEGRTRLHVTLAPSVEPGTASRISFEAESTPEGWIGDWKNGRRDVAFPSCVVLGANRDEGALAVHAGDDLEVRPGDPQLFKNVTPLDANEKARFGLGNVPSDLVYRYEGAAYSLAFVAERATPTITARTFSFLKIESENLAAHYELVFNIDRAGTQQLAFWLPPSTPESVTIRGLDGIAVKEYTSTLVTADGEAAGAKGEGAKWRRWNVQLAAKARDKVRLAVDLQQRLPAGDLDKFSLPLVRADERQTAYQSGLVAVEGNAELDVAVKVDGEGPGRPKRIDVGELAQADYVTGRRVLGAFGFVGETPEVAVDVFRRPAHSLPSALAQRAELITLVARSGLTQTAARYQFRTKELFLELRLPKGATLWSAYLDGQPLAPQRSGDSLLLSLTAAPAGQLRDVQVVYEAPIRSFAFRGQLTMPAPTLRLRTEEGEEGEEVLVADLQWQLVLPSGYRLTNSGGTVSPDLTDPTTLRQLAVRRSPWLDLAAAPVVVAYGLQRSIHSTSGMLAYTASASKSEAPFYAAREGLADESIAVAKDMDSAPMSAPQSDFGAIAADPMGPAGPGGGAMPPGAGGMGMAGAPKSELPVELDDASKLSSSFRDNRRVPMARTHGGSGVDGRVVAPGSDRSGRERSKEIKESASTGRDIAKSAVPAAKEPEKPQSAADAAIDAWADRPSDAKQDGERFSGLNSDGVANTVASGEKKSLWALEGVRSLPIEFTQYVSGGHSEVATFRSLGIAPRLEADLVNRQQLRAIALSAALLLLLYGLALTNGPAGAKTQLIVVTLAVVTVLPLLGIWVHEVATVCDHVFWAAIGLTVWYLLDGLRRKLAHPGPWRLVRGVGGWWKSRFGKLEPVATPAGAALNSGTNSHEDAGVPPPTSSGPNVSTVSSWLLGLVVAGALLNAPTRPTYAQDPAEGPQRKVTVPADAIIVPYNPDDPQGARRADRILVPLQKYQELWGLANPGRAAALAEAARLPAQFAWSGARYDAALSGTEDLLVRGTLDLEIFAGGTIDVPLALSGGVITSAQLDGQPASLRLIEAAVPVPVQAPAQQAVPQAPNAAPPVPAPPGILALTVRGPGRKQLVLTIGMKLQRRGGWRVAEGRVPVAPSTSLALLVPEAKTEVRLGDVYDRGRFDTTQANEKIETALGSDGILNLQWRPKVAEAEVDKSLTVTSAGDVELREDAVRVVWQVNLEFPRSRRETFSVFLPGEYLLERVLGDNIRGWNVTTDEGRQRLDVTLLKAAVDHESFALVASRRGRVGDGALAELALPSIEVVGAALHSGIVSLARSPWLDVRLSDVRGLDRTDVPAVRTAEAVKAIEESPLGVQPYQALRFATSAYAAHLRVIPLTTPPVAELRSVWKIDPREMSWETQAYVRGGARPTYQFKLRLPEALIVDQVTADNLHDWAITSSPAGRVLTIYLTTGVRGDFPVLVRGRLPAPPKDAAVPIPQLKALEVSSQDSHIVVQVDPSVDVRTEDLQGIESVLLSRTFGWLGSNQRGLARLALHVTSAEYTGALRVVRRTPRVTASSVTNVRVTGRSIEETILIDFRIEEAGIRSASFLLPAWMKDARITAPLLREKRVAPLDAAQAGAGESQVRVQLDLQDEVMGSFRVLVENDRLLTAAKQTTPLPTIETGRTEQRLVAIESSGRDEVAFDEPIELDTLNPQQQAWKRLTDLFGQSILAGYLVKPDAREPRLTYQLRERQTVETAGARIGLAETQLEVDVHGAYRAKQTFQVDNGTEQFLEIQLPAGAKLWTAVVAGEPVKPQQIPGGDERQVRIPIVKTAPGDLDYSVELKYGGRMPAPGAWGQLKFPLMKATNINVELSRVRLLLPPTHRWFQFGGTMGRVDERGKYEAGFLEYQTKQLSRLSELLQDKTQDDLRRLRVTNNLKQLGQSLQMYNSSGSVWEGEVNDEYSRNLSTLNSVLTKTNEQVQAETAQQQIELAEPQMDDNRTKLNAYFQRQETSRASNVVGQLGGNFDQSESKPTSKSGPTPNAANPFNDKWFDANGLAQKGEGKGKARIMNEVEAKKKDVAGDGVLIGGKGIKQSNDALREQIEELQKNNQPQRRSTNRAQEESQDLNRRYQQRLQQQQGLPQGGGQQFQNFGQNANPNFGLQPNAPGVPQGQPGQPPAAAPPQATSAPGNSPSEEAAPAPPRPAIVPSPKPDAATPVDAPNLGNDSLQRGDIPAGLASLIVELPGRGDEYLFTTPRGELEITVYAVDSELLGRVIRLAAVAVVLLVVGLIAKIVRAKSVR